jgi:hypothetical protein
LPNKGFSFYERAYRSRRPRNRPVIGLPKSAMSF